MPPLPLAGEIFAHGIGGQSDLPIPLGLTIAGAVAALTVSFTVLAVAWRTPRYDAATSGRAAPAGLSRVVDSRGFSFVARLFGFAVFAFAVFCAVFGEDTLINPFFGIVYAWWWVGLPLLSLVLGPVWKAISPVRTINLLFAKASGSDPDQGVFTYPERLGHWPAAVGLFAFVWMELVFPYSSELGPVRLWCAVYVGVMLLGGALYGNTFYERADPFEVYSTLAGKLSIWGRRDGVLVVRSPLANLDTVPVRPGLVAVVAVLFGSTAFDSFSKSQLWTKYLQTNEFITSRSWAPDLANNLALLAFCVGVGAILAAGTMLTEAAPGVARRDLPNQFAHSVVPIVVGYVFAHYLTLILNYGQETLVRASDPLSNGSNWFGTADWSVHYFFATNPTALAAVKVLGVVLGHVVGVISAHDRALRLLPRQAQLVGQLPLLVAMIAFTVGGLSLLFAA